MKNWTVNAMESLQKAQAKAYEMGHAELEPLHLLWALLSETGLATNTLRSLELDPALIAQDRRTGTGEPADRRSEGAARGQRRVAEAVPGSPAEKWRRHGRHPRTAAGPGRWQRAARAAC